MFTTRPKHVRTSSTSASPRLNSLTPAKLGVERRVGRRGSDWQTRRRQRRSNGPMEYDRHCNDVATIEAPSLRRDPLLVTYILPIVYHTCTLCENCTGFITCTKQLPQQCSLQTPAQILLTVTNLTILGNVVYELLGFKVSLLSTFRVYHRVQCI